MGSTTAPELALGAFKFGQLPVEPCGGVADLLLDLVDILRLEGQPVDDLLGDVAGVIRNLLCPTTARHLRVIDLPSCALILDDSAD